MRKEKSRSCRKCYLCSVNILFIGKFAVPKTVQTIERVLAGRLNVCLNPFRAPRSVSMQAHLNAVFNVIFKSSGMRFVPYLPVSTRGI